MEDEAAALKEMQAKVEKEMGSVQGDSFLFLFELGCFVFLIFCYLFFNSAVILKKRIFLCIFLCF